MRSIRFNAFHEVIMIISITIFKLLLDASYVYILYPFYKYAGFGLSYSFHSIIIGFFMFLPVIVAMPKEIEKPSDLLLFLLVTLMYVPMTSMYSFSGQIDMMTLFINMVFWLIVMTILRVTPTLHIPQISGKYSMKIIPTIFLFFLAYIIITAVVYTDFDIIDSLKNFFEVYERRAAYKEANIPMAGYFYNWAGNVIFPCALMFFLYRKNIPGVLTSILAVLVLFAVTGFKSQMFGLLLVIIIFILMKLKKRFAFCAVALIAAVGGSMLIYKLSGNIVAYSTVVRRPMFLPVQIAQHYFDFFMDSYVYSSNSIFSSLLEYPYSVEPPSIIGSLYYIKGDTHANTGVVTDGFVNFGYFGVIVWALLFGFLLKLADSISKGKSFGIVLACLGIFSVTFSNSALFTTLSTHGFFIALVMVYLSPPEKELLRTKKKKNYMKESGNPVDQIASSG